MTPTTMHSSRGQWWTLLIRGILALLLGLIIFANPHLALTILLYGFAIYTLLDGIFHIYLSISYRQDSQQWWLVLLSGLISVGLGLAAFAWPNTIGLLILLYLAVRAIIDGLTGIITGVKIGRSVQGEWVLIAGGVIAVLFGGWMLFNPRQGGILLLQIIGVYAVVMGGIMIVRAFLTKRENYLSS